MSEFNVIAAVFGSLILGSFMTLFIARESKIFVPLILLVINALAMASFRVASLIIGGGSGLTAGYQSDLVQLLDVFYGISITIFVFGLSTVLILVMIDIFTYFILDKRANAMSIRLEEDRR